MTFNLEQVQKLMEVFDGKDAEIQVWFSTVGHSGEGLYALFKSCPDKGTFFLGKGGNK